MSGTRSDRSPPQALQQKRRHTKSKNGCATCKMRRVKVGQIRFPPPYSSSQELGRIVRAHTNHLSRSAMKPYHIAGYARHEVYGASTPRCQSSMTPPLYRQPNRHRHRHGTAQLQPQPHPPGPRLQTPSSGNTTSPTPAKQSQPPAPTPLTHACGPNRSLPSPSATPWYHTL